VSQAHPTPEPLIRIKVLNLSLSHFRNYTSGRVETDAQLVVLVGPNGAGKTNLLEAISLLTPGRGLRRAALSEINAIDETAFWAISAEIMGSKGLASIGTGRDPESDKTSNKRIIKIDGKISRGQAELASLFSALWLTPQMDTLFIEGDSVRRKFFDRLVYSFDAEHASRINAYEYAMRERNRLLGESFADPLWLTALEQKMAEKGIATAVARQHTAERLNQSMQLAGHSFPKASIALTGTIEKALEEGSALFAEEQFRTQLEQNRPRDGAAGRALSGIHRTVVEVSHIKKSMKAELCSSGEQKALLVSIILAQARSGAMWHGRVPVLLLDEVATHLDLIHRAELFAEISDIGAQTWITGTDSDIFSKIQGHFLRVESGKIKA
jgi:DNA replication and repair protein RecF